MNVNVEWDVHEDDSNAVVWYSVENAGIGREVGTTITKT
jgi:hypothetical protein